LSATWEAGIAGASAGRPDTSFVVCRVYVDSPTNRLGAKRTLAFGMTRLTRSDGDGRCAWSLPRRAWLSTKFEPHSSGLVPSQKVVRAIPPGPFALLSLGSRDHHDAELAAFLHRDERVVRAQHQVHEMIRKLLVEAGKTGDVRDDVSPDELAGYCPQRPRGRRQTALEGRCVSVLFAMMFISPL